MEFIVFYDKYLDYFCNSNGKLFSFWMFYFDIVEIFLNLLRVFREGDWELYLIVIRKMIFWCFVYDNFNYVCYLLVYVFEMFYLEEEYLEVFKYFKFGGFLV